MVSPSPPLPQTLCGRSFRALVSQKNFDAISEHSLFFQIKSMTSKNLVCMPLIGSIYGIFMDDICTFAGGQVGIFINLAPWQSTCLLQVFILLAGFYTRWGRGIQQVCWLEISTWCSDKAILLVPCSTIQICSPLILISKSFQVTVFLSAEFNHKYIFF